MATRSRNLARLDAALNLAKEDKRRLRRKVRKEHLLPGDDAVDRLALVRYEKIRELGGLDDVASDAAAQSHPILEFFRSRRPTKRGEDSVLRRCVPARSKTPPRRPCWFPGCSRANFRSPLAADLHHAVCAHRQQGDDLPPGAMDLSVGPPRVPRKRVRGVADGVVRGYAPSPNGDVVLLYNYDADSEKRSLSPSMWIREADAVEAGLGPDIEEFIATAYRRHLTAKADSRFGCCLGCGMLNCGTCGYQCCGGFRAPKTRCAAAWCVNTSKFELERLVRGTAVAPARPRVHFSNSWPHEAAALPDPSLDPLNRSPGLRAHEALEAAADSRLHVFARLGMCLGFCRGDVALCAGRAGLLADAVLLRLECLGDPCKDGYPGSPSSIMRHLVEGHRFEVNIAADHVYDGLRSYLEEQAASSLPLRCSFGCARVLRGPSHLFRHLLHDHPSAAEDEDHGRGRYSSRHIRVSARRVLATLFARDEEVRCLVGGRAWLDPRPDAAPSFTAPPLTEERCKTHVPVRMVRQADAKLGPRWVQKDHDHPRLAPAHLGLVQHMADAGYLYGKTSIYVPLFDGTFGYVLTGEPVRPAQGVAAEIVVVVPLPYSLPPEVLKSPEKKKRKIAPPSGK